MKLEIVFKDGREVAQTPAEGKLFEVNPLGIDRSRFENPMRDKWQECTRQLIQEAFAEVDKHPEKYASPFYTLIPEKNWNGSKTVAELNMYANDLGGLMADWVEQALEWAQRISNGESWEAICNYFDPAPWYRLIVWKNGDARLVGGSFGSHNYRQTSFVLIYDYLFDISLDYTVPLVVFKKK